MRERSRTSANPHGSSSPPRDFAQWIEQEAARSPGFRDAVHELRKRANTVHPRIGFIFAERTFDELRDALIPPRESTRIWSKPPVSAGGGDYYNDDVRRYLLRLKRVVGRYLGRPSDALLLSALHEHVRGQRLTLPLTGKTRLEGAVASTVAAYVTGNTWHVATVAQRQQWYEVRAQADEEFTIRVDRRRPPAH
jgi:hypothetical protein